MSNMVGVLIGSFDPFHLGHQDIAIRASFLVSDLVIAIHEDPTKEELFGIQDRKVMVEQSLKGYDNITVADFSGSTVDLIADLSERLEANNVILVNGVRNPEEYQQAAELAYGVKKISGDLEIETLFMSYHPNYSLLSDEVIRDAILYRKDCSDFLPKEVFDIVMFRDEHPSACLYDNNTKVLGS